MSLKSNLIKAGALGAAITALSIGAASAAVATASVNVRTGPSTGYRVIDTLQPGEYVSVSSQSGGWCRISRPNGWVSCAYLTNGSVRDRPVYRPAPTVTFGFGFGTPYPRHHYYPHRSRHDYSDHHWSHH